MSAHRDKAVTLQVIPMPADTIAGSYISAGWLLAEMDKAGGRRAFDYARGRTVTVGITAMSFHRPVFVGDAVSVETEILRQGRSSLTIGVEAFAERRLNGERVKVTAGQFTFVATDGNHRPVPFRTPPWQSANFLPPRVVSAGPSTVAPAEDLFLSLRDIPAHKDTNYTGDVFGGWILAQMDRAGGARAMRLAGRDAATVGLEAMTFHKPVFTGDEVSFYTRLVKTGRTSVTLDVETWVCRRLDGRTEKVTEGLFTYVALDEDRRPAQISDH